MASDDDEDHVSNVSRLRQSHERAVHVQAWRCTARGPHPGGLRLLIALLAMRAIVLDRSGSIRGRPTGTRMPVNGSAGAGVGRRHLRDRPSADEGIHGLSRRPRPRVRRRGAVRSARRAAASWARSTAAAGRARPAGAVSPPTARTAPCSASCNHDGAFADLIAVPQTEPARRARHAAGRHRRVHRAGGRGVSDSGADPHRPDRSHRRARRRTARKPVCAGAGRASRTTWLVVGKHPEKLALLDSARHRDRAACRDLDAGPQRRHRRRRHRLGHRTADGARAGPAAWHHRAEDDRRWHADAWRGRRS